jgi:hypothetical protein
MPKHKYQAHGAIWDSKVLEKFVFLACEDGSIRIVKVKKNKIELVKMLVKSNSSCLSVEIVSNPNVKKTKTVKLLKKDL